MEAGRDGGSAGRVAASITAPAACAHACSVCDATNRRAGGGCRVMFDRVLDRPVRLLVVGKVPNPGDVNVLAALHVCWLWLLPAVASSCRPARHPRDCLREAHGLLSCHFHFKAMMDSEKASDKRQRMKWWLQLKYTPMYSPRADCVISGAGTYNTIHQASATRQIER